MPALIEHERFTDGTLVLRHTEIGGVRIKYDDGTGWTDMIVMHGSGGGGADVAAPNQELLAECHQNIEFVSRE